MRRCFTDPHYWKNPALRRSREKRFIWGVYKYTRHWFWCHWSPFFLDGCLDLCLELCLDQYTIDLFHIITWKLGKPRTGHGINKNHHKFWYTLKANQTLQLENPPFGSMSFQWKNPPCFRISQPRSIDGTFLQMTRRWSRRMVWMASWRRCSWSDFSSHGIHHESSHPPTVTLW